LKHPDDTAFTECVWYDANLWWETIQYIEPVMHKCY